MEADFKEYISAGYFLTTRVTRPPFVSPELMPPELISLSSCINDFFPGIWNLEWCGVAEDERARIGRVFGMTTEQQALAMSALDDGLDVEFGWESVIFDLATARSFRQRFLPSESSPVLIGAALHRDLVEEFLEVGTPPPPKPGFSPEGAHGTVHALRKGAAPASGAKVLGFEPMAFDRGLTCSWLCNGLEKLCFDRLGVAPNSNGFIDSAPDAKRCVELIESDEVGAEPGLWLPWLLLEYPC